MSYIDKNFKAIEQALNTLNSDSRAMRERITKLDQSLSETRKEMAELRALLDKSVNRI